VVISVPKFCSDDTAMFKSDGCDLMGAVFEVYNELGYGMAEEI
jgi:hypothetical protein